MPRKASANLDLVGKAVEYLKKHPTLSTAEAMKLAGFSEEETKNRSTQKLVRRKLPNKSKTNQVSFASGSTVDGAGGFAISCNGESALNISPLTQATSLTSSSIGAIRQTKIRRLNSQQKQDERVDELERKMIFKDAHKAATIKYDEERKKEGGMSVRKVAEKIKSEYGVGPSASTIHHYVSDLGLVGASPHKTGPEGSILPVE